MGSFKLFLLFTATRTRKGKRFLAKMISALKSSPSSPELDSGDGNISFLDFPPNVDLQMAVLMETMQSEWAKCKQVMLILTARFSSLKSKSCLLGSYCAYFQYNL